MIEIKNLYKTYISKSKERVEALKDVSLMLPSKGLVFLLGESGAGKSTLLNIIGGIERADSGEISVNGLDIHNCSDSQLDLYRNGDVGFIFQDFNLLDNFNVGENIMLAYNLQNESQADKVEQTLATVNMASYSKRKIKELSGGQKQRVAIARAIIKNPKIILADEPTGALDFKTGKSILELLKEISKDSLVLVVSHDEVFANSYADRIIRIAEGEIIEDRFLQENKEEDSQDIRVENTQQSDTKKKYALSTKTVTKMAVYSLGSKKIRLAFTLLLCIVCFAVFGIADTLAAWNCEKVVYDAITLSDDKYMVNWTNRGGQLIDDYTKMYEQEGYRGFNIQERYLPIKAEEMSYGCYKKSADGFIEIDDNTMQELDAKLYAGRYPVEQGEIAISYHVYRGFKAGAYKTNEIYIDGSMIEPTDGENGILGKIATISDFEFKIVGIVDTGYDYEKNSHIDPLSDNYDNNINVSDNTDPDGHSIIFLPKGGIEYINTLLQTSEYDYGVPTISSYTFEKEILNELAGNGRAYFVADLETFQKSGTKILWFGEERKSLADDELIISYNDIDDLLGSMTYIPGMSGSLGQGVSLSYVKNMSGKLVVATEKFTKIDYKFFSAYTSAKIYEYALQNAEQYKEDENVKKIADKYTTNDSLTLAVAYYLSSKGISNEIQTGYLNNPYGKSGLEIVAENNISLLNQYDIASQFDEASLRTNGKQIKVKIVGVYIPNDVTGTIINESRGSYYLMEKSRALINPIAYQIDKANLESKRLVPDVGLIRIVPENEQRIKNAISQYLGHDNDDGWSLFTNSKVLEQAGYMKGTMDILKTIFYYVSLGIGIFASIMLGNYLINSIMARKKEIGILRAIGATSRDIFHICLFEGMILFAIIFSLASIVSGVAGAVINSMIKSDLDIMIPISVFGIRQVALIFVVSLAVTLVVSLIGSYVVSKRKPIDVIR